MSEYSGSFKEVGLAKEATRGTPVTVPTGHFFRWETADFKYAENKKLSVGNVGTQLKNKYAKVIQKLMTASLGGEVDEKMFSVLCYALMGAVATTSGSPEAGVNSHLFTWSESNLHPTYTGYEVNPAEAGKQYPMMILDSLKLTFAEEEFAKVDTEWLGNIGATTSGNGSYVTNPARFAMSEITFELDTDDSFSAPTTVAVKTGNLDFKKNAKQYRGSGSETATKAINTDLEANGSLEFLVDDATYRELTVANGYKALRITMIDNERTIGLVSHPKIVIVLPSVAIMTRDKKEDTSDFAMQTLNFEVVKNDDVMPSITVINDWAIGDVKG